MILTLVRHGQSANNRAWDVAAGDPGRYARVPEPSLTELGHRQAEAVAAWLAALPAGERPTRLECSPMARALQTARPVAEALGLDVHLRMDAFEVGGPYVTDAAGVRSAHPGLARAGLAAHVGEERLPGSAGADGWWAGPYEDEAATLARARRLADALRSGASEGGHVVLVTHQAFCQYLLAGLMGMASVPLGHFRVQNTATCSFDVETDAVQCRWLNGLEHLPREQRSG